MESLTAVFNDQIARYAAVDAPLRRAIASAERDTETSPTHAQKQAGNYAKGRFMLHGFQVVIENPAGSFRKGVSADGHKWTQRMPYSYGYISAWDRHGVQMSEADGDHIDVFMGPDPESELVFVVDQQKPDGAFDEAKCLLGFHNEPEAQQAYLDSYSTGWTGLKSITAMTLPEFREWLENGDTRRPVAHYALASAFNDAFARYAYDESKHPRDDGGRFTSGSGATKSHVTHAAELIREKIKTLTGAANTDMQQRQYLGRAKDFWHSGGLPEKVANAHVFFDPKLTGNAAHTEGRTITIGQGAIDDRGTSGVLGETFIHEIEHLHDEHSGIKRQEFSPRLRQLLRESADNSPMTYLNRHSGRDNAEAAVREFFRSHPGHDLTEQEIRKAADMLISAADERFKEQVGTAQYAFDESKHPRGQPENSGEFVKKGHVDSQRAGFTPISRMSPVIDPKTQEEKPVNAYTHARGSMLAEELHQRAKKLALPPAWTGVQIADDPSSPLQAVGLDSKGRMQYRYSSEHSDTQAAAKFERVKQFVEKLPEIRDKIKAAFASDNHADREAAAVLSLIDKTGFRVGSERDTGAEVQAHGATTLDASHVEVSGDKVTFKFVGKKGVEIEQMIHDQALANMIGERQSRGGKLFDATDSEVRDFLHKIAGNFKVKDFRTAVAADTALRAIESMSAPKNDKEFKQKRTEVGTIVSAKLGNTATVALASYIPPEVFQSGQVNLTNFNDYKTSLAARATTGNRLPKKSKRPDTTTPETNSDDETARLSLAGKFSYLIAKYASLFREDDHPRDDQGEFRKKTPYPPPATGPKKPSKKPAAEQEQLFTVSDQPTLFGRQAPRVGTLETKQPEPRTSESNVDTVISPLDAFTVRQAEPLPGQKSLTSLFDTAFQKHTKPSHAERQAAHKAEAERLYGLHADSIAARHAEKTGIPKSEVLQALQHMIWSNPKDAAEFFEKSARQHELAPKAVYMLAEQFNDAFAQYGIAGLNFSNDQMRAGLEAMKNRRRATSARPEHAEAVESVANRKDPTKTEAESERPTTGSGRDRWVTIGSKNHHGGTPVKIDDDGKITAGPKAIEGKPVDQLPPRAETQPKTELPPVPENHVRFFHGGNDPKSGGGRWVSPQQDYAQGYADKSGGGVHYVDIPKSAPHMQPGEGAMDDWSHGPEKPLWMSHELPEEWAKHLKPVNTSSDKSSAKNDAKQPEKPSGQQFKDWDGPDREFKEWKGPAEHGPAEQPGKPGERRALPGWDEFRKSEREKEQPPHPQENPAAEKHTDPKVLADAQDALLALGHTKTQAKQKIKEAQGAGKHFGSVEDVLRHFYGGPKQAETPPDQNANSGASTAGKDNPQQPVTSKDHASEIQYHNPDDKESDDRYFAKQTARAHQEVADAHQALSEAKEKHAEHQANIEKLKGNLAAYEKHVGELKSELEQHKQARAKLEAAAKPDLPDPHAQRRQKAAAKAQATKGNQKERLNIMEAAHEHGLEPEHLRDAVDAEIAKDSEHWDLLNQFAGGRRLSPSQRKALQDGDVTSLKNFGDFEETREQAEQAGMDFEEVMDAIKHGMPAKPSAADADYVHKIASEIARRGDANESGLQPATAHANDDDNVPFSLAGREAVLGLAAEFDKAFYSLLSA